MEIDKSIKNDMLLGRCIYMLSQLHLPASRNTLFSCVIYINNTINKNGFKDEFLIFILPYTMANTINIVVFVIVNMSLQYLLV